jgi:hypothetical protein
MKLVSYGLTFQDLIEALVQLPVKVGWKSCGLGHGAFTLGHHLRYRFG